MHDMSRVHPHTACRRLQTVTTLGELAKAVGTPVREAKLDGGGELERGDVANAAVFAEGATAIAPLRWGFVAPKGGWSPIVRRPTCAPIETIETSTWFGEAYATHRCLIPVTRYRVDRARGGATESHWFVLKRREPFAIAGVWLPHPDTAAEDAGYFAIVTTRPNALAMEHNSRMPLILAGQDRAKWLTADDTEWAHVEPYPASGMITYRVPVRPNAASADEGSFAYDR